MATNKVATNARRTNRTPPGDGGAASRSRGGGRQPEVGCGDVAFVGSAEAESNRVRLRAASERRIAAQRRSHTSVKLLY